jgi:hypothetical protein
MNVRNIGQGEARHREFKGLKFGGSQADDRWIVWAVVKSLNSIWTLSTIFCRKPGLRCYDDDDEDEEG